MQAKWDDLVNKGRDTQALLYGVVALVAAAGVGYLGVIGWTLAIGNLALPSWSMFAASGFVALIGLGLLVFSDREKCKSCGGTVERNPAYFPLETEPQVTQAVQAQDAQSLLQLQPVPKNQMKMHLDIAACPGCGQIAELDLSKWQDYQQHTLAEGIVVQGPQAAAFRQLAQAHAEWRGDDDE